MKRPLEISSAPEREIVKSYGNNSRIEREFNEKLNRDVEYVDVLGVRVRRRDQHDTFGEEKAGMVPVFQGSPEVFKDLSFGKAETELLKAALMRYAIGHHTLFLGPPGFGKSRMLEFMAYLLNVPFARVQCEKGMDVSQQFLWTYVRDNGSWKGRLGPLPQSILSGGLLLVDELPNLEPAERQVILGPTELPHNPRMTGKVPTLHLHDYPGMEMTIQARPGWFLVATGNYREGQGVGEIYGLTEREERRIRPYMLGVLPAGTGAKRMSSRYRGEQMENTKSDDYENKAYQREATDLPDEVINFTADLFEIVDRVLKMEVLNSVRQEPKVFLTEAIDRAFDHFMYFQLQSQEQTQVKKVEDVIGSALLALEFYYVNAFRAETRMKLPDVPAELDAEMQKALKSHTDKDKRVLVRDYITWRLKDLLERKIWEQAEAKKVNYRERLEEIYYPEKKAEAEAAEKQKQIDAELAQITTLLGTQPAPQPLPPPSPVPPQDLAVPTSPKESPDLMRALEASYEEIKETLKTFNITPKTLPTIGQIMPTVWALGPEKLAEIAQFNKPTLLITPGIKRDNKIKAINSHKLYKDQVDTYCDPSPADALWGPEKTKLTVSIVDGALSMPIHSQVPQDLKVIEKVKKYQEIYTAKGMKMISADEYLTLQMLSLHRYKQLISQGIPHEEALKTMVENWADEEHKTVTLFNVDHISDLTSLSRVPYGYFDLAQVSLYWNNPDFVDDDFRSRPSVWISEF